MITTPTRPAAQGWMTGNREGREEGVETVIGRALVAESERHPAMELAGAILDGTGAGRELPFPGGFPHGQFW